jgi:hypothetical protein
MHLYDARGLAQHVSEIGLSMPGFHFDGNFQNAFSERLAALRLCDAVNGSESAGAEKVAYVILATSARIRNNGAESQT